MTAGLPRSVSPKQTMTIVVVGALAAMWWMALSNKASAPAPSAQGVRQTAPGVSSASAVEPTSLPAQLQRPQLEAAHRDPFTPFVPPAPKPLVSKKAPLPVLVAAPPVPQAVAAPSPPPLNLRFVGQAWLPSGERMIFASLGETPVELKVGARLLNGYQVTRIEDKAVLLTYAPLNFTAQMALPEPPRYEIR